MTEAIAFVIKETDDFEKTTHHLNILSKIDIPGLLDLCASVQWDYDDAQIRTILAVGTIYGHKDEKGRLVSCAAVIPYEEKLATIGMVIVHSSCRGLGLGRELIEACLKTVSPETTVMLISTEQGKPLYESLGFGFAVHTPVNLVIGPPAGIPFLFGTKRIYKSYSAPHHGRPIRTLTETKRHILWDRRPNIRMIRKLGCAKLFGGVALMSIGQNL